MNTLKNYVLYAILTAAAFGSCKEDVSFNPNIHNATATIDGEQWEATARASMESVNNPMHLDPETDNYLRIILKHDYPNSIDKESLHISLPASTVTDCYEINRRYIIGRYRNPGKEPYFFLFGIEWDAIREEYTPDTARSEVSTICITSYSPDERVLEGTFDLYLKTADDFPYYDDANRPATFSMIDGEFRAYFEE